MNSSTLEKVLLVAYALLAPLIGFVMAILEMAKRA